MSKLQVMNGAPNEIIMVREFDAPKKLVIQAMTTPELLQRWLGGKRAQVTKVSIDLRVGGTYRYVFQRRDGGEFAFGGEYRELGDDRIVQSEKFDGSPSESVVTTTFLEAGGRTTVRIAVAFESAAVRDMVMKTGMTDGAGESYDELESLLAESR
jgi:uncharacterized protein YndB with AHSA1/START domain